MKKLKFTFKNAAGEELAGLLELPENPKAFALIVLRVAKTSKARRVLRGN